MNNYVAPCITPVGGKHVVADGFWTTNDHVATNQLVVTDNAVALAAVAAVVTLSLFVS